MGASIPTILPREELTQERDDSAGRAIRDRVASELAIVLITTPQEALRRWQEGDDTGKK